ncbi:MAG: hypothetical protein E6Q61_00900 [Nitrosomonas sp.]|nr:MAG: hypothetical protein E6Q61_00900 [Nitrosomonas sp.]
MRIHVNRNKPLPLESSIQLPEQLNKLTLAEAVRFGIVDGNVGQHARNALLKAFYLVCLALRVDFMLVCARYPVHKLYLGLLFQDISPNDESVKLSYANNIPHRLLKLGTNEVESLWEQNQHSLYRYFFKTRHPDLDEVIHCIHSS